MIGQRGFLRLIVPLGWRLACVVVALLGLVVVWEMPLADFKPAPRVAPTQPSDKDTAADEPLQTVVDTTYPAIGERPLFYPNRTRWQPPPPPPPPPPQVRAPPPLNNYMLAGVIVSGNARTALVKAPGGRQTMILAEGQKLDGWTLQEIAETRLLFVSGNSTYEMKLPKPSESGR
jgi:type II secretory pathway component PulC